MNKLTLVIKEPEAREEFLTRQRSIAKVLYFFNLARVLIRTALTTLTIHETLTSAADPPTETAELATGQD